MFSSKSAAISVVVGLLLCSGLRAEETSQPAMSLDLLTSDAKVSADGSVIATVHTELKALNDAGAMQASRINLPFSTGMQTVEIIEAHTLKADGTKIPVDPTTIMEQLPPAAAQSGMITDQRVKVLFFPQFGAGDTAVYTARITSAHPLFPNQYFAGEIFPRTASFKEVRETVTAPKSMVLRVENHDVTFSKKVDGENTVYSWHYSAPQPRETETASVSPIDKEPRFFVSSFKDYAELGRAYAALAQPKIVVTAKVKALADQITGGETNHREQTRKLYEWVVKHIRFVAIELGRGSFVPHDVDSILANGYGDCKDHDTLMQSLLKAKGIEARSVLINSSNAYTLTEAPTFTQLDHVITFVPELDIFLDSSIQVAPFGVLPLEEYGKPIIFVSATGATLSAMPVLKPGAGSIKTTSVQKFDTQGNLSGTTTTTATGPYAITLRLIGLGIQALGQEKAAAMQLASRGYKDGTGKLIGDPPLELGSSYTVRGEFTSKPPNDKPWGTATIMPGGLRVLALTGDGMMGPVYGEAKNAAEPTLCFSASASEDISVEMPAGYTVRKVPDDVKISTANLTFTANWKLGNNTLSVHREFSSKIDSPLCSGAVRTTTAAALKKIAASYDAELIFERAGAAKSGSNDHDVESIIKRGIARSDSGDEEMAVKDFDAALKLEPNNTWAMNARAVSYDKMGKTDLALAEYTRILNLENDYQQVYYNRALVYMRLGKYDEALRDLDQAVKLDPTDANALIDRSSVNRVQGQPDRAIDDIRQALALRPDDAKAYNNRAAAYLQKNEFQLALQDANDALKRDAKNSWAMTLRAEALQATGHDELAAKDLDAAVAADPKNEEAFRMRGVFRFFNHNEAGALADLSAALAIEQQDVYALAARGDVYRALKQYDRALADYAKVIALQPDMQMAYTSRAAAYFEMGKPGLAMQDCATVTAAYPDRGWAWLVCSKAKRLIGDDKGANQDVAKALKLDPTLEHNGALVDLVSRKQATEPKWAAIEDAGQHLHNGDYAGAIADFERAGKLGLPDRIVLPGLCGALAYGERAGDAAYQCSRALQYNDDDAGVLEARGYAYFRQGKYQQALDDFNHAARVRPDEPRYLYERGLVKLKLGDKAGGEKDKAKATEKFPNVARSVPRHMAG